MPQESSVIKYLMSIRCDQNSNNYLNVTTDCKSRFPENGFLEVKSQKEFYKMAKNNGWGHHGWDYWRCPNCEKL